MKFTHVHRCPYCNAEHDRSSTVTGESPPAPQSISICIRCGEIGVFDAQLILRPITGAELLALHTLDNWPEIKLAQDCIRARCSPANLHVSSEAHRANASNRNLPPPPRGR